MIFMSRYCFISSSSNYIKEVPQKMIFRIPACSIVHMKSQHAAPTTQTPLQTCPLTLTYKARVQSLSEGGDVQNSMAGTQTGIENSEQVAPQREAFSMWPLKWASPRGTLPGDARSAWCR